MLEDTGVIESPAGLRALIESVYGDDAEAPLPDALQGRFFDAEGRAGAERGAATTNVLNLAKGYVRDGGTWDSDVRTPTRLDDDPTVTLRLGRAHGDCIEPYAHSAAPDESWRAWRLSEVNVSARRVGAEAVLGENAEAVAGGEGELDTVRQGIRSWSCLREPMPPTQLCLDGQCPGVSLRRRSSCATIRKKA